MTTDPHPPTAELAQRGVAELSDDLAAGRTTSVALVDALLSRVEALGGPDGLHAVLAVAPQARAEAADRDADRVAGRKVPALHGIPVLVKDNVEAVGLPGSAGSLALAGRTVVADAPLVARLRAAGCVVLGATNLSEWANIRSSRSTSGWSAVGGLTANPWAWQRSAGGSSSGSGAALAAGLAPLAVGTETDGSITCPASLTGVVGLKPTVGLVPTAGVVPISASQDCPGPMARSVRDAALLLEGLTGTGGYADAVARGTAGLRLALATTWFTGHPATDAVVQRLADAAAARGVDVRECAPAVGGDEQGEDELTVLLHELRDDLDAYLAARPGHGARSLADVIAFDDAHADAELAWFGHDLLERAAASGGRADAAYPPARERNLRWAVEECLVPAFDQDTELLLAPAFAPAWLSDLVLGDSTAGAGGAVTTAAAIAGWPILTLPAGLVAGLPVGVSLVGPPGSEDRLLAAGHALEGVVAEESGYACRPTWAGRRQPT